MRITLISKTLYKDNAQFYDVKRCIYESLLAIYDKEDKTNLFFSDFTQRKLSLKTRAAYVFAASTPNV